MNQIELAKGIGALLFTGTVIILLVFVNFLLRKSNATVFGVPIPASTIHAVLGPLLVIVKGALVVFLCALLKTELDSAGIKAIQTTQIKMLFGPLFNPFYVSASNWINGCGYAFLIILWWIGMHSFVYSIHLNPESKWLFGWQMLISAMFLALGLTAMFAIQSIWAKMGLGSYRVKWLCGFIGIPIGAFLPPFLLRLGVPKFFG